MTPANETDADKKKADKPSRESYSFLNNAQDGSAKSKTNLIQVPSITLPQGGGAIKSIDEKFSVNPANGTAGFSLPLPFSPGRNGQNPALSLSYNSGGGNSIFGIGWGIDIAAIQRRTDKKLPEYKDAEESDVFMISGAEDLVPMLKQDAGGNWVKAVSTANGITRTLYRPRIESAFSRIEKVDDNGNLYWVTRTKENLVAVFGKSDDTKLYDPGAAGKDRIQKWCLEYSYDDKGNFVQYSYKKENKDLLLPSLAEKNRLSDMAPFANIYLKAIRYGNVNAWYEGDPLPSDFLFELVLDYGEHDLLKPTTKEIKPWTLRPDPFSNFKAGFEIRTYRLCRRVLMFHHFQNEFGWNDYLVRSLLFEYDEQPHITYLERIIQTGYIWNTDGSLKSRKSIPPLEFSYFKPGFSREVQELPPDSLIHDPVGLDGKFYQWTDLYSEGISGILTEQGNGWYYKENRGNGIFSPARLISPKPSFTGLSSGVLTIQDLQADGSKYVVKLDGDVKGYFPISAKGEAEPFHTFDHFPNIDLKDPNLKFLDLDGDGMPDMLISQAQEFIWYASKGISGYDDYHLAARAADAERGPQVLFSSQDEALLIATADMSGDGLSDIVLITCSGVSYYPNLGYGKFGVRVNMVMEDVFDASEQFNVKNIHFSDIDGSGTTDIIYTGNGRIQIWFNQSGNNLSAVSEFFNPFPALDDESKITFADLLGNGTSCMVWSSALPHYAGSPLRYIDLMNGQKPHILSAYKNNIGKEVTLEYRSSTHYYLDDKKAGNGWVTKLPFPVQCLSKMVVTDKVSQTRFANEYSYHHGYYDAIEREFRGFARVEQRDSEMYETFVVQTQGSGALNSVEQDLWQPTVITKSWYHTGAYLILQKMYHHLQQEYYPQNLLKSGQISDPAVIAALQTYDLPETPLPAGISTEEFAEYSRSLKGLPLRQEVYSDEGSPDLQMHPYTVTQYNYDVQMLQPRSQQCYAVFLSHEKEKLIFNFERNPLDPRIAHSMNLTIDPFGNVIDAASVIYGRKKPDPKLPLASDRAKQTAQYITWSHNNYTAPIDTDICFRLPVSCEAETWELNAPLPATNYFTCDELKQIFNAASVKLYEQTTGLNEKRKIEHARTLFLRNDLNGPMPLGQLDTRGLPCENYLLAFTPTLLQSLYGGKQDESLLRNKARYVRSEGDSNYWIRSGKTYYHPDLSATPGILSIPPPTAADVVYAKSNFFAPVAFEDNFGNLTKVFYDSYKLQINRRIDALQNETNIDAFNYRTLTPYLMRDANNNRSGVRFDELGLVTHAFVMGKEGEFNGDWLDTTSAELSALDQPTSVVTYAFRYFDTAGKLPCSVKMSVREQHYYTEPQPAGQPGGIQGWLNALFGSGGGGSPPITVNVTWQDNYAYSDGSGHVVLKKIQAEPGPAPQRNAQGVLITDASGKPQLSDTAPEIRW
ncbi:MAG TPA: SpvB/TcaC N-terminal domain-containing protein, partial [Bacteroidia bacterium]|nr:SpvB/TcaC N-terminal domain-containing protein [Bacteroidia bacterium]